MRLVTYVTRVLWALLFVGVFVFALKNEDLVTLRLLPGLAWEAPLIVALLAAFFLGALLGVLACLSRGFRQHREILRLKRELRAKGAGLQAGP
ncbi:MAG TPA: LapA family protein [Burkholderiales bacterium]|jgi:uncharacterized integral membrane protein